MSFFDDFLKGLGKGLGWLPGGDKVKDIFDTTYGMIEGGGDKPPTPERYKPMQRLDLPQPEVPQVVPTQAPMQAPAAMGQSPIRGALATPHMDRALQGVMQRLAGRGRY